MGDAKSSLLHLFRRGIVSNGDVFETEDSSRVPFRVVVKGLRVGIPGYHTPLRNLSTLARRTHGNCCDVCPSDY